MRIAYFDCVAGASGDMILGTLVDAGVPLDFLQQTADALQIAGLRLTASKVKRGEISATKVEVEFPPEKKHRHLHHIREIIEKAGIPEAVKRKAIAVFQRLAEAEAKVHQTTLDKIHFHEVGAVDAIADVVCSVAGIESFALDTVWVSHLSLGGGTVMTEHGVLPVPAPATSELIRGFPSRIGPVDFELVTPTGAAILTTLATPYPGTPFHLDRIGYGAGTREHEGLPNVLRIFIGESDDVQTQETVTLIETNIDDMNPEIYPFVIERLLERGALDAFLAPIIMKKGRPGVMLSVLSPSEKFEDLLGVIYAETTTLGVRIKQIGRRKLQRRSEKRMTSLGEVRVKIAEWQGKEYLSPEFEECRRIALEKGLPLREVFDVVRRSVISNQ